MIGKDTVQSAVTPVGTIDAIHGPVVDVSTAYLPPIHQALTVSDHGEPVMLEVYQHLDNRRVRAIALHSTAGLSIVPANCNAT